MAWSLGPSGSWRKIASASAWGTHFSLRGEGKGDGDGLGFILSKLVPVSEKPWFLLLFCRDSEKNGDPKGFFMRKGPGFAPYIAKLKDSLADAAGLRHE